MSEELEKATTRNNQSMEEIADIAHNLGLTYSLLASGDRQSNLRRAITRYQKALQIYTRTDFPQQWAKTQRDLGKAYQDFLEGDNQTNLENAIACYENTLQIYTLNAFPAEWAKTQHEMGDAYRGLTKGDRQANLRKAVTAYENALKVYKPDEFYTEWSVIRSSLDNANSMLADAQHYFNRQDVPKKGTGNLGVIFAEPGKVAVEDIGYPKLELPEGVPGRNRKCEHGIILKVVATSICGSDQHMVRYHTTTPRGQTLGHEITGEIVELGSDVEFLELGDLVSVPFNIACGRCRMCKTGNPQSCLNVNPRRPGAIYGYADMGGWVGGQAMYVMVPYADWNVLKFPDKDQAMEKIKDLTMLSDIFPTGYHGAFTAGVTTGSTVYIAGAGPIGLACAASAQLLGATVVIVGDMNSERLAQARSFGCETIDLTQSGELPDKIEQIVGEPQVDAAVDCVGFEARGHGAGASESPATVLNDVMSITRVAGRVGIPGLYVTGDPGGIAENAKIGQLGIRIGLGWAKSLSFITGHAPVMRYHRQLMNAILHDKVQMAKAVNATVISLEDAPQAYQEFDKGKVKKFILDPNSMIQGFMPKALVQI